MQRKAGSGLHHRTATVIERLVSETFSPTGGLDAIRVALAKEVENGRCGVSIDAVSGWIVGRGCAAAA